MSELQLAPAELTPADVNELETEIAIRQFCINALALSVPEFMNRDKAADLMVAWFPGDRMALATLYRAISQNQPPRAA